MSKTYAIADLHGRFDLLEMALACLAECAEPSATLVTLGDYIDRGPDSRKIVERLNLIWKIYPDDDDGGHGQHHVVHGHHQHAHGPISKRTGPTLTRLRGTLDGL
jgi:hypothetical protein